MCKLNIWLFKDRKMWMFSFNNACECSVHYAGFAHMWKNLLFGQIVRFWRPLTQKVFDRSYWKIVSNLISNRTLVQSSPRSKISISKGASLDIQWGPAGSAKMGFLQTSTWINKNHPKSPRITKIELET